MRSPYLWFVERLSRAIGGEFPAHYDSHVHRQIRLLFVFSPLILGLAAFSAPVSPTTFRLPTSPGGWAFLAFAIGGGLLTYRLSYLRKKSIEHHVLEATTNDIVVDQSADAAANSVTMFDYLKVFFVLELLFLIPLAAFTFVWNNPLLIRIDAAITFIQMYYMFLIIDLFIPLIFRWGSEYISNDIDSQSDSQSPSSK